MALPCLFKHCSEDFIIFGQYLSKLDAKNDGKKLRTTNRVAFLCMEVKLAYTHQRWSNLQDIFS